MLLRTVRALLDPDVTGSAGGGSSTTTDATAASSSASQSSSGSDGKTLADVVLAAAAASSADGQGDKGSGTGTVPDGDRLVVSKPAEGSTAAATQQPQQQQQTQAPSASAEDPDARLPFHDHPRWKEVYGKAKERDEFEAKLREAEGRFRQAEPHVQAQQALIKFCQDNGITVQQFREVLDIQGLINRGDPKAALARVKPIYDQLAALNGEATAFDPDIAKMVETGQLNDQIARQWQADRAQKAFTTRRVQLTEQERKAANDAAMADEVARWDYEMRKKDTAFAPSTNGKRGKYELTQAFLNSAWMATPPRNSVEALRLVQQAYDDAIGMLPSPVAPAAGSRTLPPHGASAQTRKGVTDFANLQELVLATASGDYTPER